MRSLDSILKARWAWAAVAGCAYFWAHLISAVLTGDRDDDLLPNVVVDLLLTAVTICALWGPGGSAPRARRAGLLVVATSGFLLLASGAVPADTATAFVPATWALTLFTPSTL